MAETFKLLAQTQATTASDSIYTVPASTSTIIRHIRAANTTAGAETLALYHNGTAATNAILPATSIAAGGWAEYDGTICMSAGEILYADASTGSSITVSVYGVEIT